jgi:hypothetical protein
VSVQQLGSELVDSFPVSQVSRIDLNVRGAIGAARLGDLQPSLTR